LYGDHIEAIHFHFARLPQDIYAALHKRGNGCWSTDVHTKLVMTTPADDKQSQVFG